MLAQTGYGTFISLYCPMHFLYLFIIIAQLFQQDKTESQTEDHHKILPCVVGCHGISGHAASLGNLRYTINLNIDGFTAQKYSICYG